MISFIKGTYSMKKILLLLIFSLGLTAAPLVYDVENDYLITASYNNSDSVIDKSTKLYFYSRDAFLGQADVTAEYEHEMPCEMNIGYSFSAKCDDAKIAVAYPNALPSKLDKMGTQSKVYRKVVADFLVERGLDNPVVNITEQYRLDLESDGVDEVLIFARHEAGENYMHAEKGSYDVIILRKIIGGVVYNISVSEAIVTKGSTYRLSDYNLNMILDVDGDGVCEIIVNTSNHESFGTEVYKMKGNSFKEILSTGCGV